MCGIVGYWNLNEKIQSKKTIEEMLSTISKRGPDDKGIWSDDKHEIVFGHSRLAIQDLSEAGKQPFLSANKNWTIVFNGEIYNHYDLRKDFKNRIWRGHSDTETIVEYFDVYGIEEFRKKAVGMYAIAAYEKASGNIYLMRDDFGEKPLYFLLDKKKFCFSSTLNGIKVYSQNLIKINPDSVINFITHGFIPDDKSIYKNVISVLPGELVKIATKENKFLISKNRKDLYSNFSSKDASIDKDFAEIDNLISKSVKQRLIGDLKVGCFLSGGIDSSLIASYANKHLNGNLETFSIGFNTDGYDESFFAEEVSSLLQTKHKSYYLNEKDVLNVASNIKEIFDQPFADDSQLAMVTLCNKVRNESNIKVALSGDGGDELFCGYNLYSKGYDLYNLLKKNKIFYYFIKLLYFSPFELVDKILHSLPRKFRFSATRSLALKLINVSKCETIQEYYRFLRSRNNKFCIRDKKKLKYLQNQFVEKITKILIKNENRDLRTRLMILDEEIYLPNDILVKADRSSMNFGLEVRAPFLDPSIHSWCRNKGERYQYLDKKSKYVLKSLLHKNIPKYRFDRPKMGFGVPIDIWLRNCLKEWAEEIIYNVDFKKDKNIDHKMLEKKWKLHQNGESLGSKLWPILVYGTWRYKI